MGVGRRGKEEDQLEAARLLSTDSAGNGRKMRKAKQRETVEKFKKNISFVRLVEHALHAVGGDGSRDKCGALSMWWSERTGNGWPLGVQHVAVNQCWRVYSADSLQMCERCYLFGNV